MKTCRKCGNTKPFDCFSKNKNTKDGLTLYCKHCVAEKTKQWRINNLDKARKSNLNWAAKNSKKTSAYVAKWRASNPAKKRAERAKERAKQAMPKWVDSISIVKIYAEMVDLRKKGLDVHVDHIIPLNTDTVCGLHVPWNLRIVNASENRRKHNKFCELLALNLV